ncbi:Rv0340 family IniB-related protein [Mycolicibacterium phlei]
MANELLDFVMSVVRDPEVAARFAADPAQAILDANLANVTVADVNALIPVVSESLSTLPTSVPTVDAGNVWASGAATAAFDAFGDQLPAQPADLLDDLGGNLIADPGIDRVDVPSVATDSEVQLDQPLVEDLPIDDLPAVGETFTDTLADAAADLQQLAVDDDGGFDIFD